MNFPSKRGTTIEDKLEEHRKVYNLQFKKFASAYEVGQKVFKRNLRQSSIWEFFQPALSVREKRLHVVLLGDSLKKRKVLVSVLNCA